LLPSIFANPSVVEVDGVEVDGVVRVDSVEADGVVRVDSVEADDVEADGLLEVDLLVRPSFLLLFFIPSINIYGDCFLKKNIGDNNKIIKIITIQVI
jgi:cytoskeletal protein CcmA (bactofilin family)